VTAFMTIYETPYQNKDMNWRFQHFKKLCETGISLAVFCSRDCEEYFRSEILTKYSNVVLIEAQDLSETWTYKTYQQVASEIQIDLPNTRTKEKDTAEYLLLMNAKTEYVNRVIETNPFQSTHFAWIDFNIFHIFSGRESYVTNICKTLAKRTMAKRFLTLPGCWGKDKVYDDRLNNDICWRFCGGFFIGSLDRMVDFHNEYKLHFENFLRERRKLVWEVNFWAYLELHHGFSVVWYSGDHNDSILRFDSEYMSFCLADLPSFTSQRYQYKDWGEYIPTSTSYLCHKGEHIINTRLVNYWLYPNGAYLIKDPNHWIKTRNVASRLIDGLPEDYIEMKEEGLDCHGGSIYGLEDIRLYSRADSIGFIATSINYSGVGRNRMVCGTYDNVGGRLYDCNVILSPGWCEKNWIPLVKDGTEYFIYKWCPFEIGVLRTLEDGGKQLVIETTWNHTTPMFSNVRGSTPFVETSEGLMGVVHFSYEGSPRRYFHVLVLLDRTTWMPISYSNFFVFRKVSIEFCIGFAVESERCTFWISNFDRDPEVISVDIDKIPLLFEFV